MIPMPFSSPITRRSRDYLGSGFTVVELVIVVAIFVILSGAFLYAVSTSNWRRERVNAVSQELAGWIEEVMSYSMRTNSRCDVTLTTGNALSAGTTIARVTNPASCPVRETNFRIPALANSTADTYRIAASPTSVFSYTPRGTITLTSDLLIRLAINPGGGPAEPPMRCVQLSNTLGLISIGSNNTDPNAATCTSFEVI